MTFSKARDHYDERDNALYRAPDGEGLSLAGLAFFETFTPSTIDGLLRGLRGLPTWDPSIGRELINQVQRARSTTGTSGWTNFGPVRRPGEFGPARDWIVDPTLPLGFEAVWLRLTFPSPGLTILIATFTINEEEGELTPFLRVERKTFASDFRLIIPGRFGRVRANLPWSRPRTYSATCSMNCVVDAHRLAIDEHIRKLQHECAGWLKERFPGTFATLPIDERPSLRILVTLQEKPLLSGGARWLEPAGLSEDYAAWEATDLPGWRLSLGTHRNTIAARRADVVRPYTAEPTSNWTLSQVLHEDIGELVCRWAISCLLLEYGDRLGRLRDKAGRRQRFTRPVTRAREFDRFLLGDGLDAATIASDIEELTKDQRAYSWNMLDFVAVRHPANSEPSKLSDQLCVGQRTMAARLQRDLDAATRSIGASAELRTAISNIRLQRWVMVVTVVATLVTILATVVAVITYMRTIK